MIRSRRQTSLSTSPPQCGFEVDRDGNGEMNQMERRAQSACREAQEHRSNGGAEPFRAAP